jgi:hypothetical protein
MLLEGMKSCNTYDDIRSNLGELLAYRNNPKRYEKLLDE